MESQEVRRQPDVEGKGAAYRHHGETRARKRGATGCWPRSSEGSHARMKTRMSGRCGRHGARQGREERTERRSWRSQGLRARTRAGTHGRNVRQGATRGCEERRERARAGASRDEQPRMERREASVKESHKQLGIASCKTGGLINERRVRGRGDPISPSRSTLVRDNGEPGDHAQDAPLLGHPPRPKKHATS